MEMFCKLHWKMDLSDSSQFCGVRRVQIGAIYLHHSSTH